MNITVSAAFIYQGHVVKCTRHDATIFFEGKQVGVSYAPTRAGIERDVDAIVRERQR